MSADLFKAAPKYVIDTCSLTAMHRVYPRDVFPGAWDKLNDFAESGILASTEQVLEELRVQDDEAFRWASQHAGVFLPLDERIQIEARRILADHRKLVDLKKKRSAADPFVIATAMVYSCVVVTEETPSGGPEKEKIPDVCRAHGLECIQILEMFRREGLRL